MQIMAKWVKKFDGLYNIDANIKPGHQGVAQSGRRRPYKPTPWSSSGDRPTGLGVYDKPVDAGVFKSFTRFRIRVKIFLKWGCEMNIFFLDRDPRIAASFHCDKHVVKMATEYAQILSTALQLTDSDINQFVYKKTHANHPSVKWACGSASHWKWLRELALFIGYEYTSRYGRIHLATRKTWLMPKILNITETRWLHDPPQVMPETFRGSNAVEAYRRYYIGEKLNFATWKNDTPPTWFKKF